MQESGSSFTGITKLLLPGQSSVVGRSSIDNDIALPVAWLNDIALPVVWLNNIALPVVWLNNIALPVVWFVCLSPCGVACVSKPLWCGLRV